LNQILYSDIKLYLEGDILFKVDRASMANSLEVRVPFLNRDVVRFASELPLSLKLRRLTGKFLLKKSMQQVLPAQVINRPKKGFNMPVAHWLSGQLRELTLDMLAEARIREQGFFNYNYVKQLLDEHFTQQRDNRKLLWTLLVFQLWYERYVRR
jgi:asparagine synthase (glutamine-hydrolysing)